MGELVGRTPPDAAIPDPAQLEVFHVSDRQPFLLFDISRAPRQRDENHLSTFGYDMTTQLAALKTMPFIVEGLYKRTKFEDPYVRIQVYPDHEAAGKLGYLTDVHKRLRDGILLALMQTTLEITIPSRTNPKTLVVPPTLADVENSYEFVLDSQDVNFDTSRAVDNWRRIRAKFIRKEIGRSPRRKL